MYSKKEAYDLKQSFWTAFGRYMAPILSAEGEKINWINYKTGEKNIVFFMEADNRSAEVGIRLTHKDPDIQQLVFDQFLQFKNLLQSFTSYEWIWQLHKMEEGKMMSKIFVVLPGVNIFKREDWPSLISFFKPTIMALDSFWSNVKYAFEDLR